MDNYTLIDKPNLPNGQVKHCLVSPIYPSVLEDLKSYKITPVLTPYQHDVQPQVAHHADMVCCHIHKNQIYSYDSEISDKLSSLGFYVEQGLDRLSPDYPNDVKYNAVILNDKLICNTATVDISLLEKAKQLGFKILHCNQGYTKCSTAIIDDNSIITSDESIAEVAIKNGVDVLKITHGYIKLEGYDYGFIGGCCTKLSKDKIYFTGRLDSHPNSAEIELFIKCRGIEVLCGKSNQLIDIGSIIALTEKSH